MIKLNTKIYHNDKKYLLDITLKGKVYLMCLIDAETSKIIHTERIEDVTKSIETALSFLEKNSQTKNGN